MATEQFSQSNLVSPSRLAQDANDAAARRRPPRSHLPRVEFRLEERRHVRHLLSIVLAVVASWTIRLMPERLRRYVATKGGDLSYRYSKLYRESVTANLRQVLGPDVSERDLQSAVRNVFRFSGRNLADMLLVPHLGSDEIAQRVPLISGKWSYLDDALTAGKGAVLITGHLGAFDFVGQALHQRGYKLTSVTGRTTSRFLFDAVTFLRRSHDMRLVEASPSGIRRVIQALRRGEGAVFLTDRDFFQNGKPVRFFGRETTLSPGAVRIARDTGAPIVPVFGIRTRTGHGMILEPAFHVEKTHDLDADVAHGLAKVTAVLERVIGSAPDQWVMFQRVWPEEPADPDAPGLAVRPGESEHS
ncbi:MAG: phosphatidylinositol dimannoside acyltransferase [Thermomicrobiales bacterium]|nr:phosphatidylinositol dimannoside acyltransferase [Thermomicrobiales bacterium]MEA2523001.1 phosphatidylinositol dimannoside acyltransferase [Thermomicrobiales bacterium]